MTTVQQKVYFITEEQRDALLNYLLNRPYGEVANGVQFLTNAPTTVLNVKLPEEKSASISAEESQLDTVQEVELEKVPSPTEDFAVLSHV